MVITRKIYGSVNATSNDVAHIDFPRPGIIRGIEWVIGIAGTAPVTGEYVYLELSCSSAIQSSTNDANGIIGMHCITAALTTSGAAWGVLGKFVGPTAIPVKTGDRCYLNVVEAGGTTWNVTVILHVDV